eukprot:COSAG02_NODE_45213_length_359_cov_0.792308_1_plen_64_part_10
MVGQHSAAIANGAAATPSGLDERSRKAIFPALAKSAEPSLRLAAVHVPRQNYTSLSSDSVVRLR